MTELNNASGALAIRELRDDELDDVAGGGGPRAPGYGLLFNGVLGPVEGDVKTLVIGL
jgi:hypothetical protein